MALRAACSGIEIQDHTHPKSSKNTTLAGSTPELPTVPSTIRSFQATEGWNCIDPTRPTYRHKLQTHLTGRFAQLKTGARVAEDLAHTEAAQSARKTREQAAADLLKRVVFSVLQWQEHCS